MERMARAAACLIALCFMYGAFPNVAAAAEAPKSATSTALDLKLDSDKDGLPDVHEKLFGTDLNTGDSDGDTFPDGLEVHMGYSPTSTSKVPLEKKILITLKTQTMGQSLGGIVFATHKVSTGKPGMRTPTGTFKVLSKHPRAWSRASKLWMPWWMQFTTRGHGIHELPEWPSGKKEGANHLGIPVSHGCVRLGIGAAKVLYDWAPIGTKIVISN